MSGWIGLIEQLLHVLRVFGCDRTGEAFNVDGGIYAGLGGDETVVADDAVYYVGGRPHNLAAALNSTSYGVRNITVIG